MNHFFQPGTFQYLYHKDNIFIDIQIEVAEDISKLTIHKSEDNRTIELYTKTYDVPQKRMADEIFAHFPDNVHSLQFLYLDKYEYPTCMARLTRRGYWKYYRLKNSILKAEIFAENCAATGPNY